jgi:hypothetical protein
MRRYHRPVVFQPKANVPMVTETRDRLALQIRMAGESLIEHPSIDAYNTLSKMLASLNRAGMAPALLDRGTNVMNTICDRYEQSRHITVESEEATMLRQSIADIDAALHRLAVQRFNKAVAEVETFFTVAEAQQTNEK